MVLVQHASSGRWEPFELETAHAWAGMYEFEFGDGDAAGEVGVGDEEVEVGSDVGSGCSWRGKGARASPVHRLGTPPRAELVKNAFTYSNPMPRRYSTRAECVQNQPEALFVFLIAFLPTLFKASSKIRTGHTAAQIKGPDSNIKSSITSTIRFRQFIPP